MIYPLTNGQPDKQSSFILPLLKTDSLLLEPITLQKQSLDIDITSILLKYRPPVQGLPAQIHTDLNMALYAGWRYDYYYIKSHKDPLGKTYQKISSRGYDFGIFVGPGTTTLSPFTTRNRLDIEYNGIILQSGVAGFIESNLASFGLSIGYDYLLNRDRKIWIYRNKPWVGFVIGIALN